MKNIYLDTAPPADHCPFALNGVPLSTGSKKRAYRELLKGLIFRVINRRPKRIPPENPLNPRCVLVGTGGNLGGAIISLPLIKGVQERWPNAHLAVVSNRQHGMDIVKRAGIGNSFVLAPEVSLKKSILRDGKARAFRQKICTLSPEVYVGNFDLNIEHILPLKSIKLVIGQAYSRNSSYVHSVYDYACQYESSNDNWLEGYWSILSILGIHSRERPRIKASKLVGHKLISEQLKLSSDANIKLVGIQANVWSKQMFKAWPDQKMAELGELLWQNLGVHLLVLGSPGQDGLSNYLRNKHPKLPFIDGVGKFSIDQLVDVVSACNAVVSNDSGLMHLSASVGTPTLAVYGMTDPKITWVYGENDRNVIIRRSNCIPCYHKVKDVNKFCKSLNCIKNISVESVFMQLSSIIN